jgi:tetratricopeptide (TPR) repeat protein
VQTNSQTPEATSEHTQPTPDSPLSQANRVGLCMIVKDEAATLADCLESAHGLVAQIVIGDTGSSDRTIDIAQAAGATVIAVEWQQDFAVARNQVLQQMQTDWVLVLDGDEVLRPDCLPMLTPLMEDANCLVINLVRQELGSRQVPYSLVSRLFRRHPAISFSRPYHETIDDSVQTLLQQEPHWKIVELAGVAIRHSGYTPEAIAQQHKEQRAYDILSQYWQQHPDDAYTCNKLGALYLERDFDQGVALLQRGLAASPLEPAIAYELHYHLAGAYSQTSQFDAAETHFQRAIEQPISSYLKLGTYTNWGTMRMQQNNPVAAQVLFERAVQIEPEFALGWFNLGTAFKALGNLDSAIPCYQRAIALDPTYAEAHQGLGLAWMKGARIPESLDSFRRAIALYRAQGSPTADTLHQTLKDMKLL